MLNIDSFKILVHPVHHPLLDDDPHRRWHDVGEGPFENQQEAVDFANSEVGLPWIVVDGAGHPVAYGDAFGLQEDNT
jgi:hypothetical protein